MEAVTTLGVAVAPADVVAAVVAVVTVTTLAAMVEPTLRLGAMD